LRVKCDNNVEVRLALDLKLNVCWMIIWPGFKVKSICCM
jgi:hypothetical protein